MSRCSSSKRAAPQTSLDGSRACPLNHTRPAWSSSEVRTCIWLTPGPRKGRACSIGCSLSSPVTVRAAILSTHRNGSWRRDPDMIGLVADPADHDVALEFFELFKTPWEFYRDGAHYDAVLCARKGTYPPPSAKLSLVYAGEETPLDARTNTGVDTNRAGTTLLLNGRHLAIYGTSATFASSAPAALREAKTGRPAAYLDRSETGIVIRIGYDLFAEVRTLLVEGQPLANAGLPTLDLHIDLLRELIARYAGPLVEIPPVPDGSRFIACLTHDVDHPLVSRHTWDHTMFGFLYRALFGSVISALRGRASWRGVLPNWWAALTLPLVHLGLARDFWASFDRYAEIDG